MMTIDCASCGAGVPPGRLACPSCGELLASVAGRVVAARVIARPVVEDAPEPAFLDDPGPAYADDPEAAPAVAERPAAPIPPSGAFRPGAAFASTADAQPIDPLEPPSEASWPVRPEPAAPRLEHVQAAAAARWASVAGSAPGAPGASAAAAMPAPTASPAALAPFARGPFVLPPLAAPLAERLVAGAAGAIAVAFLLPWGDLVIGAAIAGEPWQRLGILASWHWLAWLGALPVILLATATTAVPGWVRLGVVPIVYGSLTIGLAWPYVLGPIGGAPAPVVAVAASLALIVLGALGVRPVPATR